MENTENRTNQTCIVAKLLPQALKELRDEKICLIEDIFKIYRMLFGLSVPGFEKAISEPEKVFDALYDMSIEELELDLAIHSALMSRTVKGLAGFRDDEYPYKPYDNTRFGI